MTTADPPASVADYVPLDDSDSPVNGHDGDDSASDVPMTTETDEENDDVDVSSPGYQPAQFEPVVVEPYNSIQKPEEDLTRKRKSSDDTSDSDNGRIAHASVKKVKLAESIKEHQDDDSPSSDWSQLPAEVWQYIFTLCPPRTLGRLLRVNRLFNVYLDPSSTIQCEQPRPLSRSAVSMSRPNAIWQSSRRRFWPNMPSPLQDHTELYMWQLSCSSSCQHCGSSMHSQEDFGDLWQCGPGKDGIAIIWPFATRSCGLCLLSKSTKVCCALPGCKTVPIGSNLMAGNRYLVIINHSERSDSCVALCFRHSGAACSLSSDCGTWPTSRYRSVDKALLVSTC